MDRFAAMSAFARVAETRSFSEAARHLQTSKSVVSRQIMALEADLGARLFHRTTRSLTLTEAGQGYYERVSRILADVDEANLSVSRLQTAPRGRLRVNAPMSFGVRHLAPAIPDFLARHPEVELDVSMNDRFVDLVDEGFDVAVRIGRLTDSGLVARKLAPLRRIVCASPAYLATRGVPQTPGDLAGHDCLSYSNMAVSDEWSFVGSDGKPMAVAVRGRLRVNNGDTLRIAALKGLGLVTQPTFIVGADLQAGTLVGVLTEYVAQDGAVYAVYPHARHLSPKVRAFVDFLAERFGPRPYWDLVE
jgi:DNA-binding transcriptional LysR family regulator